MCLLQPRKIWYEYNVGVCVKRPLDCECMDVFDRSPSLFTALWSLDDQSGVISDGDDKSVVPLSDHRIWLLSDQCLQRRCGGCLSISNNLHSGKSRFVAKTMLAEHYTAMYILISIKDASSHEGVTFWSSVSFIFRCDRDETRRDRRLVFRLEDETLDWWATLWLSHADQRVGKPHWGWRATPFQYEIFVKFTTWKFFWKTSLQILKIRTFYAWFSQNKM